MEIASYTQAELVKKYMFQQFMSLIVTENDHISYGLYRLDVILETAIVPRWRSKVKFEKFGRYQFLNVLTF